MLGICLKYQQRNYGSKLQAFATVKMLENLGINFEIIRYDKKTFLYYLKSLPRVFNPILFQDKWESLQRNLFLTFHPNIKKNILKRNIEFDNFDLKFTKYLSPVFHGYSRLKEETIKRYSKVLSCSDQLWSPAGLTTNFYNLNFANDSVAKVSWASSFGVSEIPWYQRKRTKAFLNRIDAISVRENQGANIVLSLTGKRVPVLLDPVFSFNSFEWDKLVPLSKEKVKGDYIFAYFLGKSKKYREEVTKFAKINGLKIVTLKFLDRFVKCDLNFGDYSPWETGPEQFLDLLRNSKYVFTDSFHGVAFSIIYHKPFIVFDRYTDSRLSKNSRIDSLCKNLHLYDRRYNPNDDINEAMHKPLDFDGVDLLLKDNYTRTYDFLTLNLCKK
jgi:hypothetical protein